MTSRSKGWIGIDPGATGGLAFISEFGANATAVRWPGDIALAAELLRKVSAQFDVKGAIEKVHSMPGNGVKAMFSFGMNYGAWQGMLHAYRIPFIIVTPQKWQKAMLDSEGGGTTKERSLSMARRLFPDIDLRFKRDDGKSDALHLARYARQFFQE